MAGEANGSVVLGDPVTVIAKLIGQPRQIDAVTQSVTCREALGYGRLIEDAEP
jgi:hypothetical protein